MAPSVWRGCVWWFLDLIYISIVKFVPGNLKSGHVQRRNYRISGEMFFTCHASEMTPSVCPERVRLVVPVAASQILTVESWLPIERVRAPRESQSAERERCKEPRERDREGAWGDTCRTRSLPRRGSTPPLEPAAWSGVVRERECACARETEGEGERGRGREEERERGMERERERMCVCLCA